MILLRITVGVLLMIHREQQLMPRPRVRSSAELLRSFISYLKRPERVSEFNGPYGCQHACDSFSFLTSKLNRPTPVFFVDPGIVEYRTVWRLRCFVFERN